MNWKDAITTVLRSAGEPMHYADIAKSVAKSGFRKKTELGATPANTVAVTIGNSLNTEGDNSPFVRSTRGYYALRETAGIASPEEESATAAVSPVTGIINALGMYWERSKVAWRTEPKLLGRQQQDSKSVNFCNQVGIYFLHDSQGIVYVGRTTDQSLGRRLQQHTVDRLNGRWDRFSWFGIYPVEEDGALRTTVDVSHVGLDVVISTLEAVLIEGLEPRQNRRRGDDFQAVEFLQSEDPAIEQARQQAVLAQMARQLGNSN